VLLSQGHHAGIMPALRLFQLLVSLRGNTTLQRLQLLRRCG